MRSLSEKCLLRQRTIAAILIQFRKLGFVLCLRLFDFFILAHYWLVSGIALPGFCWLGIKMKLVLWEMSMTHLWVKTSENPGGERK
jgi:hypothetical protein